MTTSSGLRIVCLEDVRKLPRSEWDNNTVADIMTPAERLITTTPSEHAAEALRALTAHDVRQLPVMEQGRFMGLLRLSDIVKWINLREQLRD
jgi:CBS domain-containing protein